MNAAQSRFADPQWRRAFLAHARHELRTPLNAVIGYSELALEELEDLPQAQVQEVRPDLERIQRCGNELLDLVNMLFDPSQFASMSEYDLAAHRERVAHNLRTPLTGAIGYCEILLEDFGHSDCAVSHEVQKMHQACQRMLGLVDEQLREMGAHAAEPLSNGVVRVQLAAEAALGAEAVAYAVTPVVQKKTARQTARLLLVDDNEMNRDLLGRRLRKQGHHVTAVDSGHRAIEIAHTEPFDIVLLDMLMPGLNGVETLQRFKADPALRDISIIMISALDEMDGVARCIELGAEDYLPKIFDPVLLQARIGACLEQKAFRDREKEYIRQIEDGKKRADELLRVILPEPIVHELQTTNTVVPRLHEDVAVLFCDVVDFTPYCADRQPEEVIANLQELIERYETIALDHGVQKIKTIGDSFMGTAGLLTRSGDPAVQCIDCGLAMVEEARRLPAGWRVRVGIHCGPVVAGVVGRRQYLFDLWGDTVNTAARVEKCGADDAVSVSDVTWERVHHLFHGESLGSAELKGLGEMVIMRIVGRRSSPVMASSR